MTVSPAHLKALNASAWIGWLVADANGPMARQRVGGTLGHRGRNGPGTTSLDLATVGNRRLRILTIAKERQHMCGCSTHQAGNARQTALPKGGSLTLRVEDMTCGHCAGTIKKAVESALPETEVDADSGSKLVSIRGTTDLEAVRAVVAEAGYTPSEAA